MRITCIHVNAFPVFRVLTESPRPQDADGGFEDLAGSADGDQVDAEG